MGPLKATCSAPLAVTLQELMLGTFFPADAFTGEVLRKMLSSA